MLSFAKFQQKMSGKFCNAFFEHFSVLFSSFMFAHVQAMNEYRGGEMSTEVVVD